MSARTAVEPAAEPAVEPADAAARLSVAIGRLVRVLRRGAPDGIGPGSVSALATLVREGPMRLGDLAVRENVSPPTLTRIVAGLGAAGYVQRTPDPEDRRAVRVAATGLGEGLVQGIGSARLAVLAERISRLTDQDRRVLLDALPVLEALAGKDG